MGIERPLYFNREGQPIDLGTWAALFEVPEYKRVRETVLPDGTWVSTVWLGLDHSFWPDDPRPLIFETMVFARQGGRLGDGFSFHDLDTDRYSTEEEAIAGHGLMVAKWQRVDAVEYLKALGLLVEMDAREKEERGIPNGEG